MPRDPTLRICLEPTFLKSAVAGGHNFINLIVEAAENARFRVEFCPATQTELFKPVKEDVFTLSHMKQPPSGRGLVFRRVYHYPFWQIDQTAERWNWDVAKAAFDPDGIPQEAAAKFAGFWKKRLFGEAPQHASRDGYIYVPLQGKLRVHRSFQICSPLEMLELTLQHNAGRKVVATLHPNEQYDPADMKALDDLKSRYAQLSVSSGEMEKHLQHCDFVVTQNSSAAFSGYFFGKAALLFAGIDFHHIAVQADVSDPASGFAEVARARPDFDKYLWWFWQDQSINAGKDDAQARIAARLRRFGWPI